MKIRLRNLKRARTPVFVWWNNGLLGSKRRRLPCPNSLKKASAAKKEKDDQLKSRRRSYEKMTNERIEG